MKNIQHIAIAGNIGSGKTTLTEMLARHYHWKPMFEPIDENPYLKDFYNDMHRWAYHLQVYFLKRRFSQEISARNSDIPVIQDRTIYEDSHIFAAYLHDRGYIKEGNYQEYMTLYETMIKEIQPPDLLIYLKADIPKLVKQIQLRNRDYEFRITLEYLQNLNSCYETWIHQYQLGKLLVIDVRQLDFVKNREDFAFIVNKVDLEINSLFN